MLDFFFYHAGNLLHLGGRRRRIEKLKARLVGYCLSWGFYCCDTVINTNDQKQLEEDQVPLFLQLAGKISAGTQGRNLGAVTDTETMEKCRGQGGMQITG